MKQQVLNTTKVLCKPAHSTVNHELGIYRIPATLELKALLQFAHRPISAPRLVKVSR